MRVKSPNEQKLRRPEPNVSNNPKARTQIRDANEGLAPARYRVTGRYSSAARVLPFWHSRQTVNNTADENFFRLCSLPYFGFSPDTNF